MLRRALGGSQTFLTAISLMVASERRMAADRFTGRVDAEVFPAVQTQITCPPAGPVFTSRLAPRRLPVQGAGSMPTKTSHAAILRQEHLGFSVILLLSWAAEIMRLPHLLFNHPVGVHRSRGPLPSA